MFHTRGEAQGRGVRRGKGEQRLRPLGTGNYSKSQRKYANLRREHSSRQIGRRGRYGPLVFTSRRSSGGAHRGGDREPSDLTQIPVSRWIG
jgi:hypothetical protein